MQGGSQKLLDQVCRQMQGMENATVGGEVSKTLFPVKARLSLGFFV
jgi:hypothetical protein